MGLPTEQLDPDTEHHHWTRLCTLDPTRCRSSSLEVCSIMTDRHRYQRKETLTGYVPFNLCGAEDMSGIPGAVNQDLAGPGVIMSTFIL